MLKKLHWHYLPLILFPTAIFFVFHLKWVHLQHDVGRELYQAFTIATQGKTLYTELTHYFGPLAPYANAAFLDLFGATIFNFSLIGLLISIGCSLLIYKIAKHVLNKNHSLIASLLFISFSVINHGGGSLFMPYSYSHSYGILLTLLSLLILISLFRSYSISKHVGFILSTALLTFTKQEYLLVMGTLQLILVIIVIQRYRSKLLNIGLFHGFLQVFFILLFHEILFKNYSVWQLWESSSAMFLEHNRSIFHNFLMLYSPTTLKLTVITLFPFLLGFGLTYLLKKRNLLGFLLLMLGLSLTYSFNDVIYHELINRGFLLNWITLTLGIWTSIRVFQKKLSFDILLIIILVSLSLYSRQQSSGWMWQGLNWIVFVYVLNEVKDHLNLTHLPHSFSIGLIVIGLITIPQKLNQGWDAVDITNERGEALPVKKEWAGPIQKTVNYIDELPDTVSLNSGQETTWLNVMTRKYSRVRNQQWWGYMEDGIISDLKEHPPDFIVTTHYDERADDFSYFTLKQIPAYLDKNYRTVEQFSNDHIGVQIWEVID